MIEIIKTEHVEAYLPEKAASLGHIIVKPLKQKKYLSELNEIELHELFTISNTFASLLFEMLNAHGTNIIITEGDLRAEVIARFQDDGLNMLWKPSKVEQGELEEIKNKIEDKITLIEHQSKQPKQEETKTEEPKEAEEETTQEEIEKPLTQKEETKAKQTFTDLRLRALRRIP